MKSQSAQDISDALDNARAAYALDMEHLMACVTDTAPNMNAAGVLFQKPHHYCVDHSTV